MKKTRAKPSTASPKLLVQLSAVAFAALFGGASRALGQSLSCPQPLLFGDIVTCATGNTVVVTPGNSRTVNGCLTPGGAPFARGRCIGTQGAPLRPMQISVAASTYTISAGANTMTINNFDIVTTGNGRVFTSTAFFVSIPIGATLNIDAGQATGTYSGSFTVNANLL
jgi:hypothetical protein